MSAELSREDIRHLSHLARLELSEEEYAPYAGQLSTVVEYVAQLQTVDTTGIAANRGVTGMENVLAEDVKRAPADPCSVDPLELIKEAPLSEGRLLEVRAVLGGEEAS